MQETRLRKLHTSQHPNFLLFGSPATDSGQYGILVGFSTSHAHGQFRELDGRLCSVYFQKHHFAVVAMDPRFLILRVRTPVLKCLIVAAHAPHTGATEADLEVWWSRLASIIPAKYHSWDRILLADANSRIGTFPSPHVGSWQAEADTEKSEYFLRFLHQSSLWLPSTFEAYQHGAGGTWRHTTGKWLRNDFIALPLSWDCQSIKAFVSDAVDLSTVKEDHALVVVELTASTQLLVPPRRGRSVKCYETDIANRTIWQSHFVYRGL